MQQKVLIGFVLTLVIVIFIPLYWVTEPGRQDAAKERFKTESIQRGAELYTVNCAACHGSMGEGTIGPALKGNPLDAEAMTKVTIEGVAGTGMPAMGESEGGSLTAHQINDVVTFMKNWDQSLLDTTIPPSSSQPSSDSSSAVVAAGEKLYQTNCAFCHGTNGAGGMKIGDSTATDIRFNALNDMYNGDWSLAEDAILDGKDEEGENLDEEMPRWKGKLSNTEVDNIIAYLQTLR